MWSKILLDPSRGFQDYWSWRECWSKVMHSARQAWMRIKLFCSRSIHLSRSHLTPFMMNVALRLGIHLACLVLLQAEEQTCSDSAPAPGAALLQAQPRKIKLWKKTGYVLTRSHTFVLSWQDYQCYLLWQACSLNSALPCHFGLNRWGWSTNFVFLLSSQPALGWTPSSGGRVHLDLIGSRQTVHVTWRDVLRLLIVFIGCISCLALSCLVFVLHSVETRLFPFASMRCSCALVIFHEVSANDLWCQNNSCRIMIFDWFYWCW